MSVAAASDKLGPDSVHDEDDLIRQGVEARKRTDDVHALELFKQAYVIRHSPHSAAQMGLAELALGRWIEAESHLVESLTAKDDPWIRKSTKALTASLDRVRSEIGTLEVMGQPRGAEILVAGEPRGTLPLTSPISVRAGEIRFELRAVGYLPETRLVHVKPRELTRETVALSPLSPPPAVPVPPGRSTPGGVKDSPQVTASEGGPDARSNIREKEPQNHERDARVGGIFAAGLGVAAIGTGWVFGLKARAAGITDSNAQVHDPNVSAIGHRYERLQWWAYGAGAVFLTVGAISYWIGSSHDSPHVEIGFAPLPEGGVTSLRGAF